MKSFNTSENVKSFLTVNESSDLEILHSIKFFSMLLVITAHGFAMIGYIFCENGEFAEEVKFPYQI